MADNPYNKSTPQVCRTCGVGEHDIVGFKAFDSFPERKLVYDYIDVLFRFDEPVT